VLIDPEGKVYYRAFGEREWDAPEILQVLRDLQKNQSNPLVEPMLHKTAK